MNGTTLSVKGISKAFGATRALRDVSVDFHPGRVHVLIGENGAGKSTLLKIISGVYRPDQGEILLNGVSATPQSPQEAKASSIAMVYQELTLLPDMTVLDNLFLGAEPTGRGRLLDKKQMRAIFRDTCAEYGLSLPPDALAGSLPLAQQQLVEVLGALIARPQIIIFDEATSALDNAEVEALFSIIRILREQNRTILFISHRMEEIFAIGDEVTVLKDGERVVTRPAAELDQDGLIRYMVGRSIDDVFPPKCSEPGEVLFQVEELSQRSGGLKQVSFAAHRGEIVGIAGLQGQGQAELLRCLAGVERYDEGRILLHGSPLPRMGPRSAIRRGVILVPEDRKTQALFLEHSVHVNLSISSQYLRQRAGFLRSRADAEFVESSMGDLSVKAQSPQSPVASLSGGNQQKVVLGRVLGTGPQVVLFNEPTRGVDVQTKQEFYRRMRALAHRGICVVLYSSDLLEVIGISDTVYTMYEGAITSCLRGAEINEVQIMRGAVGMGEVRQ